MMSKFMRAWTAMTIQRHDKALYEANKPSDALTESATTPGDDANDIGDQATIPSDEAKP